jgi:hypothetical protein
VKSLVDTTGEFNISFCFRSLPEPLLTPGVVGVAVFLVNGRDSTGGINDGNLPGAGMLNHPVVPSRPADGQRRYTVISAFGKDKIVDAGNAMKAALTSNFTLQLFFPVGSLKVD